MGNCCGGEDDSQEEEVIYKDPENVPRGRITSSQAKSSYLREKLKAREESQSLLRPNDAAKKTDHGANIPDPREPERRPLLRPSNKAKKIEHGAIPDPRQAANMRGEKLNEAEQATDRMKTSAYGFYQTVALLKK